jgi:Putative polyhydroxyalkanoic acid system protein (PHA_gran_rgn)
MSMTIDFKHSLSVDEAKERVRALGEYLTNRHGIGVTWDGPDRANVNGKYMVVSIKGHVTFTDGVVHFEGEDPGFLWRGKAKSYLTEKLEKYMNAKTPVSDLPRK